MTCKDHSEAEEPWMCKCTATKISNLEMKLEAYKNPGKAKDAALVKALDALEKIKEMTAIVDRKKAEDLIPEIYHFANDALAELRKVLG